MQPLSTLRLALANLAQKPFRTLSLSLVVAIFTFMLYAGSMVSANLESGIQSLSARMGADLLVVPQGEGKRSKAYSFVRIPPPSTSTRACSTS